jgi:hypothetical protein
MGLSPGLSQSVCQMGLSTDDSFPVASGTVVIRYLAEQ